MSLRRAIASVAVTALLVGSVSLPALAEKGGRGNGKGPRISQQFEDMGDFQWGLQDVTKMTSKGVFKGRGGHMFAPGAKISHQEAAVALVRLLDKETEALALSASEIDTLLGSIPDREKIALWARPAVAMLVKVGVLDGTVPLTATGDANRLDVAVLLVKALGYDAEAQAKMNSTLPFKDAHLIPADRIGYVVVAVDHKLITGYDDRTFRPNQAVKRIEMAVMMGRADDQIDRHRQDEIEGVIKSVDASAGRFVVTTGNTGDVSLTLAEEASVFVDNLESELSALTAGMTVQVKLDSEGKAEYVEAKSVPVIPDPAVLGEITALVQPSATSLGLISVGGIVYPVSSQATILLNDHSAAFADLRVGDSVSLNLQSGLAIKVEATRTESVVNVNGSIASLAVATTSSPATITVNSTAFALAPGVTFTINGQSASFTDLRVGDSVSLTLQGNAVTKVEVNRQLTAVFGVVSDVVPASGTAPATLSVSGINRAVPAAAAITINAEAATLADLRVGDNVKLTLAGSLVYSVEVTRPVRTASGPIVALVAAVPASGSTPATPAQITVSVSANGSTSLTNYTVLSSTQILVNGVAAQFADLHLGDNVKVTLWSSDLHKIEVTR